MALAETALERLKAALFATKPAAPEGEPALKVHPVSLTGDTIAPVQAAELLVQTRTLNERFAEMLTLQREANALLRELAD